MTEYENFLVRLKLLAAKRPDLIGVTLSNIFTMRLIGNKTHGDLAEIAMVEFINQYMYDFRSEHVGKDRYRQKSKEEDIVIIDEITNSEIPVSLKAYGPAFLQLSTDKESEMFSTLEQHGRSEIGPPCTSAILGAGAFANFAGTNVLALVYNEKEMKCNVLVFDYERARQETAHIRKIEPDKQRKHPVYRFFNSQGQYICEVRYGGPAANALQRGMWTHTKHAEQYFDSITDGWIDYSHNRVLVRLFSHALVATSGGHEAALLRVVDNINQLKTSPGETP